MIIAYLSKVKQLVSSVKDVISLSEEKQQGPLNSYFGLVLQDIKIIVSVGRPKEGHSSYLLRINDVC